MPKKETIFVICAHSDDQIIGAGGTLAKYSQDGKIIYTYILAYGEKSHPHLKEEVISSIRVKEALDADEIIGGKGVEFLGIKEGSFLELENVNFIKQKLKEFISLYKPNKIFTHSWDDFHPDHKATFIIVKEVLYELKSNCEGYSFEIWNPFTATNSNSSRLVVDISETFVIKKKALYSFKSQHVTLLTMLPAIYIRAAMNGLNYHLKYAEVFYKFK